jgi:Asp/Glu/hydantoin racemase
MAPLEEAMARLWPDATLFNLLEESLYAEVDDAGNISPRLIERLKAVFKYVELAKADGAIFTGSTFGPAVDEARASVSLPLLKPDEAMTEVAVRSGRRIGVMCTAKRAIPVIAGGVEAAARQAGKTIEIVPYWVPEAQAMLNGGKRAEHDELVRRAAAEATDCDVLLMGQISMAPAARVIAPLPGRLLLTSPDTAVAKLRSLLGA